MTLLPEIVAAYLERRRLMRLSSSRLDQDRRVLQLLLEEMQRRLGEGREIPPSAVRKEDLLKVLTAIRERGVTARYVNAHAASLRVFFRELLTRELLLKNPAEGLGALKDDALPRYVPTEEEMRRLLLVPDVTTRAGLRDRALLELLYGTGLRKRELFSLRLEDVDLAGHTVFIRNGKGAKDRLVPITQQAARWMTEYLKSRPLVSVPNFFLSPLSHRELEPTAFRLHFCSLLVRAGLPERMTTHAIRHACALHLLERGADVVSIQKLLGHAKLDTTAVYLRLTTGHLRTVLERSHPRR